MFSTLPEHEGYLLITVPLSIITVVPIFLTLPNLFSITIREVSIPLKDEYGNVTSYASIYVMSWSKDVISKSETVNSINTILFHFNMWLYSVILKLVPCIVLTIITIFLILELYKAGERSQRLRNGANRNNPSSRVPGGSMRRFSHGGGGPAHTPMSPHTTTCQNGHPTVKPVSNKRKKSTDRTTRLLIAILVLFLLTEFPQVNDGYYFLTLRPLTTHYNLFNLIEDGKSTPEQKSQRMDNEKKKLKRRCKFCTYSMTTPIVDARGKHVIGEKGKPKCAFVRATVFGGSLGRGLQFNVVFVRNSEVVFF